MIDKNPLKTILIVILTLIIIVTVVYWSIVFYKEGITPQRFFKEMLGAIANLLPSASGYLGEWKFEDNVNDTSGYQRNGLKHGVTFETSLSSQFGKAGRFAGTSYAEVPNFNMGVLNNLTITGWLNSGDNDWTLFSKYTMAGDFKFLLSKDYLSLIIGPFKPIYCQIDPIFFKSGTWHFLALTYSAPQIDVYIDGIKKCSGSLGSGTLDLSSTLYIGADKGVSGFYDGLLDDFKIYNKTLTSTEIQQIYTQAISTAYKLIAYYPFEGNANDVSGNGNNGTLFGQGNTVGGTLNLDGTGDYVDFGNNNNFNLGINNFTISGWFKAKEIASKYKGIIGKWGASPYYYLALFSNNKLNARLSFPNPDNTYSNIDTSSDSTLLPNTWYHFAFTADRRGSTYLYLNGVLQKDTKNISAYSNSQLVNSNNFSIGRIGNSLSGWDFNGSIDEIKSWNYALTATDIASQYDSSKNNYTGRDEPGCENHEIPGTRCLGNYKQSCGDYNNDDWYEWPSSGYSGLNNLLCGQNKYCYDSAGYAFCDSCSLDTANCNNDPSDKCETNLLTDKNNCGSCGSVCPNGYECRDKQCFLAPSPLPENTIKCSWCYDSSFFGFPETIKLTVITQEANDRYRAWACRYFGAENCCAFTKCTNGDCDGDSYILTHQGQITCSDGSTAEYWKSNFLDNLCGQKAFHLTIGKTREEVGFSDCFVGEVLFGNPDDNPCLRRPFTWGSGSLTSNSHWTLDQRQVSVSREWCELKSNWEINISPDCNSVYCPDHMVAWGTLKITGLGKCVPNCESKTDGADDGCGGKCSFDIACPSSIKCPFCQKCAKFDYALTFTDAQTYENKIYRTNKGNKPIEEFVKFKNRLDSNVKVNYQILYRDPTTYEFTEKLGEEIPIDNYGEKEIKITIPIDGDILKIKEINFIVKILNQDGLVTSQQIQKLYSISVKERELGCGADESQIGKVCSSGPQNLCSEGPANEKYSGLCDGLKCNINRCTKETEKEICGFCNSCVFKEPGDSYGYCQNNPQTEGEICGVFGGLGSCPSGTCSLTGGNSCVLGGSPSYIPDGYIPRCMSGQCINQPDCSLCPGDKCPIKDHYTSGVKNCLTINDAELSKCPDILNAHLPEITPIAYYSFEKGDPSDFSGNENHGVVVYPSIPAPVTGAIGKGFYFDGIDDYVRIPYVAPKDDFDIGEQGFTYNALIKPDSFPNLYNLIMGMSPLSDSLSLDLYFGLTKLGYLQLIISVGEELVSVLGKTALVAGQWYQVSATYGVDGSIKIYLNGELDGQAGPFIRTNTHNYSGRDFYIGSYKGSSNFKGTIDEVKIWPFALSKEELKKSGYDIEMYLERLKIIEEEAGLLVQGGKYDEAIVKINSFEIKPRITLEEKEKESKIRAAKNVIAMEISVQKILDSDYWVGKANPELLKSNECRYNILPLAAQIPVSLLSHLDIKLRNYFIQGFCQQQYGFYRGGLMGIYSMSRSALLFSTAVNLINSYIGSEPDWEKTWDELSLSRKKSNAYLGIASAELYNKNYAKALIYLNKSLETDPSNEKTIETKKQLEKEILSFITNWFIKQQQQLFQKLREAEAIGAPGFLGAEWQCSWWKLCNFDIFGTRLDNFERETLSTIGSLGRQIRGIQVLISALDYGYLSNDPNILIKLGTADNIGKWNLLKEITGTDSDKLLNEDRYALNELFARSPAGDTALLSAAGSVTLAKTIVQNTGYYSTGGIPADYVPYTEFGFKTGREYGDIEIETKLSKFIAEYLNPPMLALYLIPSATIIKVGGKPLSLMGLIGKGATKLPVLGKTIQFSCKSKALLTSAIFGKSIAKEPGLFSKIFAFTSAEVAESAVGAFIDAIVPGSGYVSEILVGHSRIFDLDLGATIAKRPLKKILGVKYPVPFKYDFYPMGTPFTAVELPRGTSLKTKKKVLDSLKEKSLNSSVYGIRNFEEVSTVKIAGFDKIYPEATPFAIFEAEDIVGSGRWQRYAVYVENQMPVRFFYVGIDNVKQIESSAGLPAGSRDYLDMTRGRQMFETDWAWEQANDLAIHNILVGNYSGYEWELFKSELLLGSLSDKQKKEIIFAHMTANNIDITANNPNIELNKITRVRQKVEQMPSFTTEQRRILMEHGVVGLPAGGVKTVISDPVIESDISNAMKDELNSRDLKIIGEYNIGKNLLPKAEYDKLVNDFLVRNLPLINVVAAKYSLNYSLKRVISMDDLNQEAFLGARAALLTYDPSFNTKFSTHAWGRIRMQINRYILSIENRYIPEHLRVTLVKWKSKMEAEIGPNANEEQIKDFFRKNVGGSEEEIEILYDAHILRSIRDKAVIYNETGEFIPRKDPKAECPVVNTIKREEQDLVRSALQSDFLTSQEREVLELSYGLSGRPVMTFREIAPGLGISFQRVGEISKIAINKLKFRMEYWNRIEEFLELSCFSEDEKYVVMAYHGLGKYSGKSLSFSDIAEQLSTTEQGIRMRYSSFMNQIGKILNDAEAITIE